MVVKAAEIAPAAYAVNDSSKVKKEDDLTYDLGNLAAFDTHPFKYTNEKELFLHARENVQLLINHIFDLPREMSDMGPLAQLPVPMLVIPREKPLPKPKKETKWEKFAREKGIQKRKKGRMIYDEEKEEYAPRFGYKKANDDLHDWAMEMKNGQDIMQDPWEAKQKEKNQRIHKNLENQAKNLKYGRGKQAALLGTSKKTPTGIPVELLMNTQDQKVKQRGKDGTAKTLEKVQFSTASMGKFDQMRQGEMERKKKGKRNQFLPVTGKEDTEKETSMKALKQVLGKEDKKRNANHFTETNEEENGRKKRVATKKLKNITKGHTKKGGRK